MYELLKAPEFEEWYDSQPLKARFQIDDRLLHIICDGYFGDHKDLSGDVWELKWKNGRRVYYAYLPEFHIFLLLGGNKNGQSKDIVQAKKIFRKYVEKKSSS
jgi:putative addiction module killer protein